MTLTSKCLLAMKLTIILLTAAFLQVSAKGTAQGITLSGKEISLEQAFSQIEKQTNFSFFYREDDLSKAKKVTVDLKNASLEQALDKVFQNQPLSYSIIGKTIVVKQKEEIKKQVNDVVENNTIALPIDIHGRIVNEKGEPVVVSVVVKGTNNGVTTTPDGEFVLRGVKEDATLVISGVGIETFEIKVNGKSEISAIAKIRISEEQGVIINTGYQKIKPNEATGSYSNVSRELLSRSPSSNILDRIENLTTSVLFDKTSANLPPGDRLLIRGRNSIFSNVAPLIVLDNFPYDGDIDNINPNDIESVTILKDAAATAIWGARAGNGVIVLTSKRGTTNKPLITLNTNISIQPRPDLSKLRTISSADEIEVEENIFDRGYYDYTIDYTLDPLSPVQNILLQKRNGQLTDAQAQALIEPLKSIDARAALEKYFYKTASTQNHSLSVSGNGNNMNYYFSAGWDRNVSSSNVLGNGNNRVSLKTLNTFKVTNKFQIDGGLQYTQNITKTGDNPVESLFGGGMSIYPYADLVNANGQGLNIDRGYRSSFTDTAGAGKIPSWKYNPLNEINATENKNRVTDILLNTAFRYKVTNFLDAQVIYGFENSLNMTSSLHKLESFYTRNLIDKFYQPGASADKQFPIPLGGIIQAGNSEIISHQGRAQLNFNKTFSQKHQVNAFAGWEIKDLTTRGNSYMQYGYTPIGSTLNSTMDFNTHFQQFDYWYNDAQVPNDATTYKSLTRLISYYANAYYSFNDRYSISATAREEAGNLFGVKTNQKGVPLWSVGAGWNISNESFYKLSWLPLLKLRGSFGYAGNLNNGVSAFATATFGNSFGIPYAQLRNPPNENLRWEKDGIFNVGIDFGLKNNRVLGHIDCWRKKCTDLMAQSPIDPTTGLNIPLGSNAIYFGNTASLKGHGFDIDLKSINIDKSFRWQTQFLFSYALMNVSKYLLPAPTNAFGYMGTSAAVVPIVDKPIYAIYSYHWAGLDPTNGDPRGYLGKTVSNDWASILNNTTIDSLVYNGPVQPPYFGALRNDFSWKGFSLSLNISYQMGFYFRRNSISYSGLFANWTGSNDYALRWQKAGDEKHTNVPSMVYVDYPGFDERETFYNYSQVLVEKGDNIRLQDARISYSISKQQWKKLPFQQLQVYAYSQLNLLLWKANKDGIDPYFPNGNTYRKNISLGLNLNF